MITESQEKEEEKVEELNTEKVAEEGVEEAQKEEENIVNDISINEVPVIVPTIEPTKEPEKRAEKVIEEVQVVEAEKPVEVKQVVEVKKVEEVKPTITSRLFNLGTGETLDNGTGYFIGNMNGIDIYTTSEAYSCYISNDVSLKNVSLTGISHLTQKEWNNYSYEMKVTYFNQVKNIAVKMLGTQDVEVKMVSNSEMLNVNANEVLDSVLGVYRPGVVYVNKSKIGDVSIINTVLHEVRHHWQNEMFFEYVVFDKMMYFNTEFNKDRCHHVLGNYIDIKNNASLWNKCQEMYYSGVSRGSFTSESEYLNAIHEVDARKFADMVDGLFFFK